MGIIDGLRGIFAQRKTEPRQTEVYHSDWPRRSEAQIWVTEDSAAQVSTAWACGSLISRSIAMLPAHVMVPRGDSEQDGSERINDHPIELLLAKSPNPEMSAIAFRERLLLSAVFHGNGFAEIERDQIGRPYRLWPIHPDRVTARRTEDGVMYFEVSGGADSKVNLPAEDVFHLAGPNFDGPLGLSLITYARNSLGLSIAQERYASAFLANQGSPSGIVKLKKPLNEAGFARFKTQLNQMLKGPRNTGRILPLDVDAEWQQVSLSFLDAEFLSQRRFGVEEICRWFGVPPQKIGDTSKQTFANYESANLAFLMEGLLPWIVRFEQEANRKLFAPSVGRARRPYVKLNAAALVRADLEKRNRSYALGRQWGWLSVNDVRRMEDMAPIGPQGDEYLVPLNMEPTDGGRNDEPEEDRQRAATLKRIK